MKNFLIIAFDGLDYDLIKKYNCKNIQQKEFGKIDNHTGITTIVTSEVFASFITGKTWEEHGIIGLRRPTSDFLYKIEKLNRYKFFRKFTGLRRSICKNLPFVDGRERDVNKDDLKTSTFFDEIPNSKAIDVPSYNKGYYVKINEFFDLFGIKDAEKELNRFEKCKKRELFEAVDQDYNLIMAYFHKPDYIQHWYWEVGKMEQVKKMYEEMDGLAKEILNRARDKFDTIIFMSDHGLPDKKGEGHNEKAFYSCNKELFPKKVPHITDFYSKILDLNEGEIESINI